MSAASEQPNSGIPAALPETEGALISADPGSPYLITVQIEPQFSQELDADGLHRLAVQVLRDEGVKGPLEVGIIVTTDAEVRSLNRQYLSHDYETDVLSFGMENEVDTDFVTPVDRPSYLGDVAISFERAAEQAPEYDHSTADEVATLLIHGLLHLLGYDDTTEDLHTVMHTRQAELLRAFHRSSEANG